MSDPGLLRALLREWVLDKKVPRGIGFTRALGTGLLITLAIQAGTGVLLSLFYAPTPDHAYQSIYFIDHHLDGGRLLRGLHHWGASAVVVLAAAHLVRVFFTGAYKRPRRFLWVVGVGILLCLLGFGFTGYLLPWDQKAFWATSVGFEIVESVPRAGGVLADLLRGGAEVGALTLVRMYALHIVVLPFLLAGLLGLHLLLVHRLGITPPGARVGEPEVRTEPFFPDHVLRELLVGTLALLVVLALAWWLGPPLEAPASRNPSGYQPRPDWYFLGLFQLLKYFEGDSMVIGTVVLPGALILGLFVLPLIDRNPSRQARERPAAMALGVLVLGASLTLTVLGALDEGSKTQVPDGVLDPPGPGPTALRAEDPEDEAVPPGEGGSRGPELIQEYECLFCHRLGGEGDEMGAGGPDLEKVAVGRDADWLHSMLLDPSALYPDTEMPSAEELEMSPEDRATIVQFLLDLAAEGD